MINALQSELTINVVASIIVSLLFLALGFLWGKYKERQRKFGKNLDEYDFYPFTVTRENFGEFSLKDFRLGMHYFLKNARSYGSATAHFHWRAKQCAESA